MLIVALVLILLIASFPPNDYHPQTIPPLEDCEDCDGSGIMPLDGGESIECPCTITWS